MKKNIFLGLAIILSSTTSSFATTLPSIPESNLNKNLNDEVFLKIPQNNTSYNYTSIGASAVPFPVPEICFGHREKFNNSFLDFSGGISSLIVVTGLSGNCEYFKYLNDKNYYFGGGGQLGLVFVSYIPVGYGLSPRISFGKENETNFHQVSFTPACFSTGGVSFFPVISYQFGFKY